MAGSFFHLWLAERAFDQVLAAECGDAERVRAAFAAGSIGPDIGFFPGGPRHFSHRVHLEACGDFLRQLHARAEGDVERALALGWGLHVYTDMAVHPWVESQVDQLLQAGRRPPNRDLWHMRLEWGVDCRFLQGENAESLWRAQVYFPRRSDGTSLLGEVGRQFYGAAVDEAALRQGEQAAARWLRRIPKLLWWTGHTRPQGRAPNPLCALLFSGIGRKLIGDWLERWPFFADGAALARPIAAADEVWREVGAMGEEALTAFYQGAEEGFARLGNADLYRGEIHDE